MEPKREPREELAAAVNQLRWVLAGLNWAGVKDWYDSPERMEPQVAIIPEDPVREPEADHELLQIQEDLGDCRRCRLHNGRTHMVFGEGSHRPRLVFVGEGPGFDEDRQGRPFVGRAGKLLDKMINALGFRREEVYICNVVKCRPPNNRTPSPDEISVCSPFLKRQIDALRPVVICALGACAAQTLVGLSSAISQLRGKVHKWRGLPLICTYHPAYLLRNPSQKAAVWLDLRDVYRILRTGQKGG